MKDNFDFRNFAIFALFPVLLFFMIITRVDARDNPLPKEGTFQAAATDIPDYQMAIHNIGKIVFGVSNFGQFANGDISLAYRDCFTGQRIPDLQYPQGTRTRYLYKGGIWVGGIIGKDTLVSTGCEFNNRSREFNPDYYPFGDIIRRSILDSPSEETSKAHSQQDYVAVFYDTLVYGNKYLSFDPLDSRPHKPLNLQVTLKSYAWSYEYADDFVIFECKVKNINDHSISGVYVGIYMDPDNHEDVRNTSATTGEGKPPSPGAEDDFAGFLKAYPASNTLCGFIDTGITGVRFLKQPSMFEKLSFNWWVFNYNPVYDFGPQQFENYRPMGNGIGTPFGDRNKYAMMSNGEIDYDQIYTYSIRPTDPVWLYPKQPYAQVFSRGRDENLGVRLFGI